MRLLKNIPLEKILFLDIETVPQNKSFDDVDEDIRELWGKKAKFLAKNDETAEEIYDRAGIYAEFGKIVCISCGMIQHTSNEGRSIRIKSFANDDEKVLLEEFAQMLRNHFNSQDSLMCGHNGKEFDFPYIARRMLINGVSLPYILDLAGKKPWEVQHIDTMELWKFGDFKNFTSLELLAKIFNIPTPKDDISGADVGRVYWEENDLDRIVTYCQKDVVTTIQLYMRFSGQPLIDEENVVIA